MGKVPRRRSGLAALRPLDLPRRLVVVLPTAETASAVAATGAVSALAKHRTRNPIDVDLPEPGTRVSAFYSGLYCDTTLVEVTEEEVRLPNVLLTRNLDVIRPLPEMFPGERADRRLKPESQLVAARQLATDAGQEATRVHARVPAEPVSARPRLSTSSVVRSRSMQRRELAVLPRESGSS